MKMINVLKVENFKCLKEVEFENIARINIIGGKNNSGKSTLLEAMFLFFDRLSQDMTTKHLGWRGLANVDLDPERIWEPLFNNFNTENKISIKINKEKMEVSINSSYKPKIASKKGIINLEELSKISNSMNRSLFVKSTQNNNEIFRSNIFINDKSIVNEVEKTDSKPFSVSYISNRAFNVPELTNEFSRIDEKGDKKDLVNALKCIDSHLEDLSINFVGGNAVIYSKIEGLERKIPIALLGDGMNRLLFMLIRIITCKNGVLLIDEIENGFHYSSMNKIWTTINEFSKRYNCQIFATTHSYECVTKAFESFNDDQESLNYIRMAKYDDGTINPKVYDYKTLCAAIENGMEVR